MNEYDKSQPELSSPKMRSIGSNIEARHALHCADDNLYETLINTNVQPFYTDEREEVYELIDEAYRDGRLDTHEAKRATIFVATESVKWVSEDTFKHYPYIYMQEGSQQEIDERLAKGLDVLRDVAYNKHLNDTHIITDSLKLALELERAVASRDGRDQTYTGGAGPATEFPGQLGDAEELVVIAVTCIDAMEVQFKNDAQSLLGGEPLYKHYIKQLECLPRAQGRLVKSEVGDEIIEKTLKFMMVEPEVNYDDLFWMYKHASNKDVKAKILDASYGSADTYKLAHISWFNPTPPKKRLLGILKVPTPKPTIYEEATTHLVKNLQENLTEQLVEYPEHVKRVVGLHNEDQHKQIWFALADKVVAACSVRNKNADGLVEKISNIEAGFKQIADNDAFYYAQQKIKQNFVDGK